MPHDCENFSLRTDTELELDESFVVCSLCKIQRDLANDEPGSVERLCSLLVFLMSRSLSLRDNERAGLEQIFWYRYDRVVDRLYVRSTRWNQQLVVRSAMQHFVDNVLASRNTLLGQQLQRELEKFTQRMHELLDQPEVEDPEAWYFNFALYETPSWVPSNHTWWQLTRRYVAACKAKYPVLKKFFVLQ